MQETWVWSLGWEAPLEKGIVTHSSILAWRIPWTVESMGSQRVRHHWVTFTFHSHKFIFPLFSLFIHLATPNVNLHLALHICVTLTSHAWLALSILPPKCLLNCYPQCDLLSSFSSKERALEIRTVLRRLQGLGCKEIGLWKWKSLSRVWLLATPWTLQSMEFSRPKYWSG